MTRAPRWDDADYVVIDVEGNGARPPELVELAVVPIRAGQVGSPGTWLVRPPSPITWQARAIHGISDADVATAPTIDQIADDVRTVLQDAVVVGHNVHVDLDVLTRSLPGWQPLERIDTLRLARRTWRLPSYRLGALVEHRHLDAGLPAGLRPHRADYDALVTARLLVDLATSTAGGLTLDALLDMGAPARPTPNLTASPSLFDLP
ncbi:3'-5' exonuclease [Antribacter sp. KLBMP9083]|uniref:3'-5' exonuclease n=1 Tax=Antribacter soli TaxID=2910976 RepID=A0AA41QHV6_9MICO|nr:3'-5' exonuclease [Antribacter soli]MCF4123006.1 3'-5' exonuclease [Antribacter soli]